MAESGKHVVLTDDTFQSEVLQSDALVVVDFWAVWCAPCRMIAPILEELATEYGGRLVVGKMDVDHNHMTPHAFGIRSIPTLLFFKDGRVVDQVIGAVPKRILVDKIETQLATVAS